MRVWLIVLLVLAGGAAGAADEGAPGSAPAPTMPGFGLPRATPSAPAPQAGAGAAMPNTAAAGLDNASVGFPGPAIVTGLGVASPMNAPVPIHIGVPHSEPSGTPQGNEPATSSKPGS